jgi:hypothetical protein
MENSLGSSERAPPARPATPSIAEDLFIPEDFADTERSELVGPPPPPPPLEPLMDDNWEEFEVNHDDEPRPPSPPPPAPAAASNHLDPSHGIPPVAVGIPAHKYAENTPDPFRTEDSGQAQAPCSRTDVHPHDGVYLLYMLVAWLHLQFHLPFRACTAVMQVFGLILKAFGMAISPTPISSLPRIMTKLEIEPTFDILPVCSSCLEVYPGGDSTPSICIQCNSFIFKPTANGKKTPLLQFPSKSIESQLVSLLAVPGVEEALDSWRQLPRNAGEYIDVFDGAIPKTLKDPEGLPFFRNGPEDKPNGPKGELRIALTLGVDW